MSRERDNEEVPTNVGALVLKGILIGAGIGIAAIGSALLGYGIYRELTKEEVDRIPVTCLRNRNEAGNECAICLEILEVNDHVKIMRICRHTYHAKCINAWVQLNASCPLCRRKVE